MLFWYIKSKIIIIFKLYFLQAAESVLNIPQISEPYKTIDFKVWSNKCRFVLILAAAPDKHLPSLYEALRDLLYRSSLA